jgi:hypothetical protein
MCIRDFGTFVPDSTLSKEMLDNIYQFLGEELLCLPGRSDFKKGRFMIVSVVDHAGMRNTIDVFKHRLLNSLQSTACLMLIEPQRSSELSDMSCADITNYVQKNYFDGFFQPRFVYADGTKTYPQAFKVRCPVTNEDCVVDDFNMALFMPQTRNKMDPLYDPPHYAPYVMVQLTSDMLSFSMFVADLCKKRFEGRSPYQLSPVDRTKVFNQALLSFQKLAVRTIDGFASEIDSELRCPMKVLPGGTRYYADHHGVALGEVAKGNFTLSLPNEYGKAIIDQWEQFFETGKKLDLGAVNAATGCIRLDDVPVTELNWSRKVAE